MNEGQSSKKILWILPYSPWPITSGGKSRQYHLLKTLSKRGHRITLLMQAKSSLDESTLDALSFLDEVIYFERRKITTFKTILTILVSRLPMLASINGFNSELSERFKELMQENWDVIQVEHSYTFQPYKEELARIKKQFVITEHNVESGLGAATYSRIPKLLQFLSWFDRIRYKFWEKEVLTSANEVIAVTEQDAEAISKITNKKVQVVINGVDTIKFEHVESDPSAHRILFIGNYEYSPNIDAVDWLMGEIMPLVWNKCPQAKILICGYAMPIEWEIQWPDERIEWCGYVTDLTVVQKKSTLFIAPLRHGGGSKLKVLEAMAAGLPIVSTNQGVSGLNVSLNSHFYGGETSGELATSITDLLLNIEQQKVLSRAARIYIQQNHDWQKAAQQLEQVYEKLN